MMNTNKLREWRLSKGMQQNDLARALTSLAGRHVDQTSISRYESGERIPHRVIMAAIRKLTDGAVTADDFHPERERAA